MMSVKAGLKTGVSLFLIYPSEGVLFHRHGTTEPRGGQKGVMMYLELECIGWDPHCVCVRPS